MDVVWEKGIQKYSSNIFLQDAAYDTVRKKTFIPIQEMKE